jgi:hypothetical protein
MARIASAVAAVASITAVALGRSVDDESREVVLSPWRDGATASSSGWIAVAAIALLIAMGAWLWFRRRSAGLIRPGASAAIEVLHRTAMARGQSLALVRVGDRVVLLGQSAQGFQRLAEFEADASRADSTGAPRRIA